MFSVRIVTTDHYVAPPVRGLDVCFSDFRDAVVYKVPIVRVFGATPAGKEHMFRRFACEISKKNHHLRFPKKSITMSALFKQTPKIVS